MKVTNNPVSDARATRGKGNTGRSNDPNASKLFEEPKKLGDGTWVYVNGEWIQCGGVSLKDEPIREDYKLCRDLDKTLDDYRRFKGNTDRERIKNEYFGKQEEYRQRAEVQKYAKEQFREAV